MIDLMFGKYASPSTSATPEPDLGPKSHFPWNRPQEDAWFEELSAFVAFCVAEKIQYAAFGGLATAAYLGCLHRAVRDIDIVVHPKDLSAVKRYFCRACFKASTTDTSEAARFLNFGKRLPSAEVKFQVFPGEFSLLSLELRAKPKRLWTYDLSEALKTSPHCSLSNLDRSRTISLKVVPLEDLLVSKLWPYLEPNMVNDLLLLLLCVADVDRIDGEYLSARIKSSPRLLRDQCRENLERFAQVIRLLPIGQHLSLGTTIDQRMQVLTCLFVESCQHDAANIHPIRRLSALKPALDSVGSPL